MSAREFNAETPYDKIRRAQRRDELNAGERGPDGLTHGERLLLMRLRSQGLEIRRTWLVNNDGIFEHGRVVVKRA